jgi:hypothetical protein
LGLVRANIASLGWDGSNKPNYRQRLHGRGWYWTVVPGPSPEGLLISITPLETWAIFHGC